MNEQYEVISPWADVDPVPIRGISSRLQDLAGKKIGLFANHKSSSLFVQDVVEKKLKETFPGINISRYKRHYPDIPDQIEDMAEFKEWVGGVDAIILAQAD